MIPELLKESVVILSLDPDSQIIYLQGLGTYPSILEILLEFDEAFDPIRETVDEIAFKPGVRECIVRIDELIETIDTDDPDVTGLYHDLDSETWMEIREVARRALALDKATGPAA